jgi:hypothetical protein
MEPGGGSDFLIQLVPITVFWIIFLVIGIPIARRKGIGTSSIVLGCFPLWTGLAVIYWASLTDKAILERLSRLEGK